MVSSFTLTRSGPFDLHPLIFEEVFFDVSVVSSVFSSSCQEGIEGLDSGITGGAAGNRDLRYDQSDYELLLSCFNSLSVTLTC